jgi:hypothetical protein
MVDQASLSNGVSEMMLKWRSKRFVIGVRPPPGDPIAASNWTSTNVLKQAPSTSYQPE